MKSFPKPASADGPRIHIGGHTPAAARRAGRIGGGFFPGRAGDELRPLLAEMRAAAAATGRDPDVIEITSGGALDAASIKTAADLGVARYIVPPLGFDLETLRANLERFATNVMANA